MSLMPWSDPCLPNDLIAVRIVVTMSASARRQGADTLCSVHVNDNYVRVIGGAAQVQSLPIFPPPRMTSGRIDSPGVPVADC